jgi:hypothetical protein
LSDGLDDERASRGDAGESVESRSLVVQSATARLHFCLAIGEGQVSSRFRLLADPSVSTLRPAALMFSFQFGRLAACKSALVTPASSATDSWATAASIAFSRAFRLCRDGRW